MINDSDHDRGFPQPVPRIGTEPGATAHEAADHALAAKLRDWAARRHIGANERAAVAVLTWLRAKGL